MERSAEPMQMPELYKVSGAVFATILLVMGLNIVADSIYGVKYEVTDPAKAAYVIEVAEAPAGGESAKSDKPAYEPSIELIATASIDAGKSVAKKCSACHTYDNGAKNKVGPNLWNIVNRGMASVDGFKYSGALSSLAGTRRWTYEELDGFLAKPKAHIKGTSMGFAGLKKAKDRAAIIAYLRSLSDSPAALPGQ